MALHGREYYETLINERFEKSARDMMLSQLELFYDMPPVPRRAVKKGEKLLLHRHHLMHGIFGMLDEFDFTVENGFIAIDFSENPRANKIKNSVGMWNFREDIFLSDYIGQYSGFTVTYTIGRGPEAERVTELIPYHRFDEVTEKLNNDEKVWMYWGEKTKESSFLPCLVSEKRQVAFILNTESEKARKMLRADVWNTEFDAETLHPFLDERYYPKFLELRFHPDAASTDRESAIMFGLPAALIEGVFVGRKIERDEKALWHIKEKLPDCYVVGLDGTVLSE